MQAIVAVIMAAGTVLAALVTATRRVQSTLGRIEVNVNGRLEAALVKIDQLQTHLEVATGIPAPPPVAGQTGPGPHS